MEVGLLFFNPGDRENAGHAKTARMFLPARERCQYWLKATNLHICKYLVRISLGEVTGKMTLRVEELIH